MIGPWKAFRSLRLRFRRALVRHGPGGIGHHIVRVAIRRLHQLSQIRVRVPTGDFDQKHNVDTEGKMDLTYLDIESPNWIFGNSYQAVDTAELREMLEAADVPYEDFTFVDLGSGKGRALLLASERPFRKIIGVEFSQELAEVSRQNIRNYQDRARHCPDIEVIQQVAAHYVLPEERLVLFLYNPFSREVMARVVERACLSWQGHPRDLIVLYNTPDCADLWESTGLFECVKASAAYAIYKTPPLSNHLVYSSSKGRWRSLSRTDRVTSG